jgi:hypothetical protein
MRSRRIDEGPSYRSLPRPPLLHELFIELACERHESLRLIELALLAPIGFLRIRGAYASRAAFLEVVGKFECLGLFQLEFVHVMLQCDD